MGKRRVDTLLAERGLYESRTRAAAAVMAGEVRIGNDGRRVDKPGQLVPEDALLAVADGPRYVSRGGVKLANALDGELSWKLREDPRVTVLERVNARALEPATLPFAPDLIAIDVSFISLRKLLGAVLACAAPRFDCLAMVKPQFEVGRERVGGGGVVREAADRRSALVAVAAHARAELGAAVLGFASSGLPGPAGNRETFVHLAEAGRAGAVEDLERAARTVEP